MRNGSSGTGAGHRLDPRGSAQRCPQRVLELWVLELVPRTNALAGTARTPVVTISAISPYSARNASPGTGSSAGRCSARPSARESRRLLTGSGAVAFTGPDQRASSQRRQHHPDEIVAMDPSDVLASARDRTADAQAKRWQHLRERPARTVEHDTGAHLHRAHPQRVGRTRLGLPLGAHLCKEVAARGRLPRRSAPRRALRSSRSPRSSPARADGRPRRPRANPSHEVACARSRGCRESPLHPLAPALCDRLAGKVHHRVAPRQCLRRGRF